MRATTTVLSLIVAVVLAETASAQMFGNRQLGRPLRRQPTPGFDQNQEEVGTLQGNERFLRRNRRPTDFVGPDLRELDRFVGLIQATIRNETQSAVQEIRRRVDRSATVNEPLAPVAPRGEMYNPQIDVNVSYLEASALDQNAVASNALATLARTPQLSGSSRIAVSMAGRTAILRGEVPSVRDRELAAVLLSFEPGISSVENDLVVNPRLRPTKDSLQTLRDRQQPREAWVTLSHGSTEATKAPVWNPEGNRVSY